LGRKIFLVPKIQKHTKSSHEIIPATKNPLHQSPQSIIKVTKQFNDSKSIPDASQAQKLYKTAYRHES